ncbi:SIR2 family protein, partial [Leucobacter celer]|uniref:SIR2 family protein n=1 Tax=Leucobacter celer TaxID=668625 RepID=UPI000ABA88E9
AYEIVDARSKGAELSHFIPMLNAPLAGIVSLNYDLLIEHAAAAAGVRISTGAQEWDGGPRWQFPENAIPLLKLHGSVSWRFSRADIPHWGIPRIGIYEVEDARAAAPKNNRLDSKLIFGGGNKLRPDEPWPALYAAFEDLLDEADTLIIIGYSFRDPHVDAAVRRWAAQSGSRRIINVDPYPQSNPSIFSSVGDLRYALDPTYVTEGGLPSLCADRDARFELIEKTALAGIPEVFGDGDGSR